MLRTHAARPIGTAINRKNVAQRPGTHGSSSNCRAFLRLQRPISLTSHKPPSRTPAEPLATRPTINSVPVQSCPPASCAGPCESRRRDRGPAAVSEKSHHYAQSANGQTRAPGRSRNMPCVAARRTPGSRESRRSHRPWWRVMSDNHYVYRRLPLRGCNSNERPQGHSEGEPPARWDG